MIFIELKTVKNDYCSKYIAADLELRIRAINRHAERKHILNARENAVKVVKYYRNNDA